MDAETASGLLAEHAPASVRGACADIAKIHHRWDAAAILLQKMVEDGRLAVPEEKVNLCIFGVKKNA